MPEPSGRPVRSRRATVRRTVIAGVGIGAVVATAAAAQASPGGDGFLPGARPGHTTTTAPVAPAVTPTGHRKIEQGGPAPAAAPATAGRGGATLRAMCSAGASDGRTRQPGTAARPGTTDWRRRPLRVRPLSHPADPVFTKALGVNDSGAVVGYHGGGADVGHPNHGFEVTRPYRAKDFAARDVSRAEETQDVGINRQGVQVGFFVTRDGATTGFVRADGAVRPVRHPGSSGHAAVDQLLGVNAHGIAAGYDNDAHGHAHAYLYDICHRSFQRVRVPVRADSVQATGVNDDGAVSGFYTSGRVTRGFVLDGGRFTSLRLGADTNTQALGIDDAGDVVGSFEDRRGHTHGFVSSHRHVRTVDVLHADSTVVNGVSDGGRLVGFSTTRGRTVGFVAS